MSDFGYIETTVKHNAIGVLEDASYKLVGGPRFIISDLAYNDIDKSGDIVRIGPYRLRVIERDCNSPSIICVNYEYPLWWMFVLAYRSSVMARVAYSRLIITLAVWGLAKYNPACVPSINDIYFVRKIKGWINK